MTRIVLKRSWQPPDYVRLFNELWDNSEIDWDWSGDPHIIETSLLRNATSPAMMQYRALIKTTVIPSIQLKDGRIYDWLKMEAVQNQNHFIFRYQDSNNYYYMLLTGGGDWSFRRCKAGQHAELAYGQTGYVTLGDFGLWRLEWYTDSGGKLYVYFEFYNGGLSEWQEVCTVYDEQNEWADGGQCGIHSYTNLANSHVYHMDNYIDGVT